MIALELARVCAHFDVMAATRITRFAIAYLFCIIFSPNPIEMLGLRCLFMNINAKLADTSLRSFKKSVMIL